VKSTIAREFYIYESFNQQDAPEFVGQLLSLLAEDCNTVQEKPFIEHKDMVDLPDKEIAEVYWNNHKARNNSFITDLFTG
jgi:ubiquitin C-terminal hydrolase